MTREIEGQAKKAVNMVIPHGYWVFSDGEHIAKFRKPWPLSKKFWSFFGIKYRLFRDVKWSDNLTK